MKYRSDVAVEAQRAASREVKYSTGKLCVFLSCGKVNIAPSTPSSGGIKGCKQGGKTFSR